jgi:hypothetical protein
LIVVGSGDSHAQECRQTIWSGPDLELSGDDDDDPAERLSPSVA